MQALPQVKFSQADPGEPFDHTNENSDFDSVIDGSSRSIRKT